MGGLKDRAERVGFSVPPKAAGGQVPLPSARLSLWSTSIVGPSYACTSITETFTGQHLTPESEGVLHVHAHRGLLYTLVQGDLPAGGGLSSAAAFHVAKGRSTYMDGVAALVMSLPSSLGNLCDGLIVAIHHWRHISARDPLHGQPGPVHFAMVQTPRSLRSCQSCLDSTVLTTSHTLF